MKRRLSAHLATILVLAVLSLAPAAGLAAGPEPAHDIRFTGVITALPADEGDPWQIAGQTVDVDAATRIRLTDGPAAVGMWAAVIADRDGDGALVASQITVMPPEVRLKGPITSIPEGRIGVWVIAGQEITVTAETRFNERGGLLVVGGWAEVYSLEEPSGALTALRLRSIEFQEEVEIYGAIQSYGSDTWTLSTIPLTVTEETITSGVPQVGLLAHAAATMRDDGALVARTVRISWQEPGGLHQAVQFRGTVESLPEGGLTGRWIVSSRAVEVTEATSIIQVKGVVEIGSEVHAVGWDAGDALEAVQITVLNSNWRGWVFHHAGSIEALPQDGLIGHWTIAGNQVQVTQQTRITDAQHVRIGAPAEVGGVQRQDGVRIATWLRIRQSDGPGPGSSATPNPQHTPTVTPGGPQATPTGTPGGPHPTGTPGKPGVILTSR